MPRQVLKSFSNKELAKVMNDNGFQFSSANSINIGRLVPQVVYYVKAYADLLKQGTQSRRTYECSSSNRKLW